MSDKIKIIDDHNFSSIIGYPEKPNLYEELHVETRDELLPWKNEKLFTETYSENVLSTSNVTDFFEPTSTIVKHFSDVNTKKDVEIKFTFDEDKYINELFEYIKSTYTQHYAQGKYQATEVIFDKGHGLGFCWGNAEKYLSRYGKKDGYNRKDLLKALHYVIMLLYIHDIENLGE